MRMAGTLTECLRLLRDQADGGVRAGLAAATLLVVAGGLLTALAPLALKDLVDTLAAQPPAATPAGAQDPGAPTRAVLGLAALYLLALCGGRLLGELRPFLAGTAEQRLYARLGCRFFGHLLALPLAFHLQRRSGSLVHSLGQATLGCQLLLATLVTGIVPVAVELLAAVVVLVHLDQAPLVLCFIASAVAYAAVFTAGTRQLRVRAREVADASLATHALLADGLLNIETVKCCTAERSLQERFSVTAGTLQARWAQLHRHRAGLGLAVTAVFTVSVGTSLVLASEGVQRGTLTLGGFVLANAYMLQLVRPLERLGAAARDIAQSLEFIRPLLDVLRTAPEDSATDAAPDAGARNTTRREPGRASPPAARPAAPSARKAPGALAISLRGVHLAYDHRRPVLQGLDLDIAAGTTVAIVGASGSGKSSIVRLLLRLQQPQSGCIEIGARDIDRWSTASLRQAIGVVPQDTVLFNDTLAANIGIGRPGARRCEIEHAARVAQLHAFIDALPAGYETPVGERGLQLSGGERQRVAIARAVLRRPRVFVFDEATAMLDAQTEAAVLQSLQQACQGCTTLLIAHRLSAVQQAQEIVVLQAGRIAERGSHAALQAAGGLYAQLWHAQTCASAQQRAQADPALAVPGNAPGAH